MRRNSMRPRVAEVMGALFVSHSAAIALAQESVVDVDSRDACLAGHEQSQELKLSGKLIESKKALLSCAEERCPSIVRADCLRWLDDVQSAIPTIVVVAESDRGDEVDVRVTIDSQLVSSQLDGKAVELNPGSHTITFEHPGSKPQEMRLILGQGEKNRIIRLDFRTQPARAPTPPPILPVPLLPPPSKEIRPVPTLTYVFGATAALAVASATYFGVRALVARHDANDSCAPLCSGAIVDDVKRKALYSDLSAGIAVLSAATALALYATRPAVMADDKSSKLEGLFNHWQLDVSSHGGLTTFGGAF